MALTENDLESIMAAMKTAMQSQPCACGLKPKDQQELPHLIGMVRDAGDDSLSKGVEVLRENARFVKRWRAACEKTGSLVLMSVVLGMCGIGATIAGMGFWEWIGRAGK